MTPTRYNGVPRTRVRLFYVAVTRAQKYLLADLLRPATRRVPGGRRSSTSAPRSSVLLTRSRRRTGRGSLEPAGPARDAGCHASVSAT